MLKNIFLASVFLTTFTIVSAPIYADDEFSNSEVHMKLDNIPPQDFLDTIATFKNSKARRFFNHSYGYAVFPTIGKLGFVIGTAYGKGQVYEHHKLVGNVKMTQASIGFQFGGEAFSQIIFLQDQRAFDEFTSGSFEFGASASAVVLMAGATAEASTRGTSITANLSDQYVKTEGQYYKGMAVFSITKGGLMYEAVLSGQKFDFKPK